MIFAIVRMLFVLPMRIQKWIERLLVVIGVLMFVWRLWKRIEDHKPKDRKKPVVPVLPPPSWDRVDAPDAGEKTA
ncbi:MAG: hypothetical protein RL318_3075 [Fibrobacterota bacterium]